MAEFADLIRAHGVVVSGDAEFPLIADLTADFTCARLFGRVEMKPLRNAPAVARWADNAATWAKGGVPKVLESFTKSAKQPRDVWLYGVSGPKGRNP